ncbi:hypothetical protein PIROE2DRAFT_4352 [Piromyces sp. E2]|nr:hypothetical protein PIROE2DRAFT_4352 [Piromyces sp. E2]|eukprot:OUM68068.1 hypothetical protein PIROE2DRAFT_4352 [Piromyces sp. E2]
MSDQHIQFKNITLLNSSTLIHGNNFNMNILDSIFTNITSKISIPVVTDSKYSSINISNTTFSNLNLIYGLIDGESKYTLENVKFTNIKTNSKYLLNFMYNDIYINQIDVENISCIGEENDASFILLNSGEIKSKLTIKNSKMINNNSNGSFIRINGESSELILENTTFDNIISYGSVIQSESKMLKLSISKINFTNNKNTDKFGCGNLQFNNNIDLSIQNSNFYKNICKKNGGTICLKNLMEMKFNLNSNLFIENKASNGGALYIKDNTNSNKYYDNVYFLMSNNSFNKNVAEDFGGAIFLEFNNEYNINMNNNYFILNNAGIMGGGLYSHYLNTNSITSQITLNIDDIDLITNYNLIGNIGSFTNGHCELNNFRIFANPKNYTLNISIENYNNIIIKSNEIEIEVLDCNDNQIRMYDKKGILYCENAKCNDDCPINTSAECIPYYKENINIANINICSCLNGYGGSNCENNILSLIISSQSTSASASASASNDNINSNSNISQNSSTNSQRNNCLIKEKNKNIEIILNQNCFIGTNYNKE